MQKATVRLLDVVAVPEGKLETGLVFGQAGTVVENLPDPFQVDFLDADRVVSVRCATDSHHSINR
jgi:hypothetical protein